MSEDQSRLDSFLAEMRAEFPAFRIVKKEQSTFAKVLDVALKIITFGGQREFMTRYYTVVGDTLYVPPGFDDVDPIDVIVMLRHERVHLRQRRRYTMIGMTLLYLMLPFPLGLAYARARMEWEAYTETLRATKELKGLEAMRSPRLRDRIVSQFTGAAYGWMWPFKRTVERWYDEAVSALEKE
ncbi:MAG: hypothetical protein IPM79_12565 [Polyangiaceae bacterium]|nr:hypothetical protein [Polyangiaceae bacterium]MBK8938440.1 hypothetical protein [Polyangiaceae bacterium]